MPIFEFVVEGPPVSLRASHKNAKRYQRWIRTVREAALRQWPADGRAAAGRAEIVINNYFTAAPPDVDNIIKPILDALNGIVYADDEQIWKVTGEKFDMAVAKPVSSASPLLVDALAKYVEFLHVTVTWE